MVSTISKHSTLKKVVYVFLLLIVSFLVVACGKKEIKVTEIQLNKETLELEVGRSETITAIIIPDNATNKTIEWSSDDTDVATVDDGVVTAVGVGSATITAKIGEVQDTVSVTVVPKMFTVTFDVDGGTEVQSQQVEDGKKVTRPTNPTKEGYTFVNWYKDEALTEVFDFNTAITQNITLYAKWAEEEYTIVYSLDGGRLPLETPRKYKSSDLPFTLPEPDRENFIFLGWYDNPAFNGDPVTSIPEGSKGTKYYYAQWLEIYVYTLTYEVNGGTNHTENISNYTVLDLPITLHEPTRDGYRFLGWYHNPNYTVGPIDTIEVAKTMKLYARWEVMTEEDEIEDVYCDPALAGKNNGDKVTYNGVEYTVGTNAFAKLSDALAAATENVYIVGTHTENVTINTSGLTLLGPNAYVDPNKATRKEEALIKGTITLASGVNDITINGLAFTENAKVLGTASENIQFIYNYIYDTTEATAAWVEAAGYTSGFFAFANSANDKLRNFIFKFNKFSNVSDVNINFIRVTNVTVDNNTFTNFDRDAIRFDNGGFNQGNLIFTNNIFSNDQLGGYNGVYFRIYGGDETTPTYILFSDNVFKNIGQTTLERYSGAISMRNYQEKDTTIEIIYNRFEKCANYINIRNNATAANHQNYTWEATINYNEFIGIPTTYYFRNWAGSDTEATNPTTADFQYNYYEDNNGVTITDLTPYASKFMDLASYANNYQTREAYEEKLQERETGPIDIYVNAAWTGKNENDKVTVNGKELTFGVNAFATLQDAIDHAEEGKKIYVLPGTYSEQVTIDVNNITIISDNMNIDPNVQLRKSEAEFTGIITLAENVKGITINGLAFSGQGQIKVVGKIENCTFMYNNFYSSAYGAGDTGLIYLKTATVNTLIHKNINILYNRFEPGTDTRIVNIDGVENVTVKGNHFEAVNGTYTDGLRIYYSYGEINIESNTFTKIQQYAIFLSTQNKASKINIVNNTFTNLGSQGGAINIRNYEGTATAENKALFTISYNSFTDVLGTAIEVVYNKDEETKITLNVNYNAFNDTKPTYYLTNREDGVIANFDYNYFSEGTPTQTKYKGVDSCENSYTNKNDLPKYQDEDEEVLPTKITIINPISMLGLLDTHQLEVIVSPENATVKKVSYFSSNEQIASISASGLITANGTGKVTITVVSDANGAVIAKMTFEVVQKERIEVRYEGNGALLVDTTLELKATILSDKGNEIVWTSSNNDIATVDANGLVSAKSSGTVIITATLKGTNLKAEVGLTVYGSEITDEFLLYLISINTGVIRTEELYYIGSDDGSADYLNRFYTSVSDYFFGDYTITPNMLQDTAPNWDGRQINIEFITIHDTAASGAASDARANSNWCTNSTNDVSSWHYTVGNDGVYQQIEDNIRAWHAGDGNREFELLDTGVKAEGEGKPVIYVDADGYFVINGTRSVIRAPKVAQIAEMGIYTTIGENGNYWMNKTYFNTTYKVIANHGGNNNSIGIETAVNNGSDIYFTWHRTAKLVARLLVKHDLGLDRMLYHNNFSGKPCPRSMLTAELIPEFESLVHAEYKVLTEFSDYEVTFVSHNPDIVDNTGRVIGRPLETTNVSYTITVTKDGVSQSITLNSLVPGQYNW